MFYYSSAMLSCLFERRNRLKVPKHALRSCMERLLFQRRGIPLHFEPTTPLALKHQRNHSSFPVVQAIITKCPAQLRHVKWAKSIGTISFQIYKFIYKLLMTRMPCVYVDTFFFYFVLFFLFSLIHSIATRVIKLAHAKSSVALAPALVETYSRLLVYMEIESLGIKGFISKTSFTAVSDD